PGQKRRPLAQLDPGLLGQLPDRARALVLVELDGAAREDPDPRHEASLLAPAEHQHLHAALAVPPTATQEDERGGRPGGRWLGHERRAYLPAQVGSAAGNVRADDRLNRCLTAVGMQLA